MLDGPFLVKSLQVVVQCDPVLVSKVVGVVCHGLQQLCLLASAMCTVVQVVPVAPQEPAAKRVKDSSDGAKPSKMSEPPAPSPTVSSGAAPGRRLSIASMLHFLLHAD